MQNRTKTGFMSSVNDVMMLAFHAVAQKKKNSWFHEISDAFWWWCELLMFSIKALPFFSLTLCDRDPTHTPHTEWSACYTRALTLSQKVLGYTCCHKTSSMSDFNKLVSDRGWLLFFLGNIIAIYTFMWQPCSCILWKIGMSWKQWSVHSQIMYTRYKQQLQHIELCPWMLPLC